MLQFRVAEEKDIPAVTELYEKAKVTMRAIGLNQWQNGVPNEQTAWEALREGTLRVGERDGRILATYAVYPTGEPDYRAIRDGQWGTGEVPYAAVHRVTVSPEVRGTGAASELLSAAEAEAKRLGLKAVRIDTHRDNKPMRGLLGKNGYQYCGRITLSQGPEAGQERLAYEKAL